MKYVDEFRDRKFVARRAADIAKAMPAGRRVRIMEVCGTHTHAVSRFGLKKLFPETLQLFAGPGCPVCVSSQQYIDKAIALAAAPRMIIATFGDMLRVPGSAGSLDAMRATGADIRVVYSPLESISIARQNPSSAVVFLAVGFETTAAAIAVTVVQACEQKVENLFFLTALKTMPPVMSALLSDKRVRIDGFLCPGHVSAIIGSGAYGFIAKRHRIGCCVTGFEPSDIMDGVYRLVLQAARNKPAVENQYARAVSHGGNKAARKIMSSVFVPADAVWRGMGVIPDSGLSLCKKFAAFDAARVFPRALVCRAAKGVKGCRCADVLKGIIAPAECPLFRTVCRPQNPVGPCMVSQEGACHAHFLYQ